MSFYMKEKIWYWTLQNLLSLKWVNFIRHETACVVLLSHFNYIPAILNSFKHGTATYSFLQLFPNIYCISLDSSSSTLSKLSNLENIGSDFRTNFLTNDLTSLI